MKLTKKKILMILVAVAVLVALAHLPKKKMQMPPMAVTLTRIAARVSMVIFRKMEPCSIVDYLSLPAAAST